MVTNEMVDVEIGSILFVFTNMWVMKYGCLEEAHNVFFEIRGIEYTVIYLESLW